MPKWFRRLSGILTIAGGSAGAVFTLAQSFGNQVAGLGAFLSLVFFCIFAAGIVIGTLLLENDGRILAIALVYWLIQILSVQSPIFSYRLFSGADLAVRWGTNGFSYFWGIGSGYTIGLGPGNQVQVGLNLVALGILLGLWRYRDAAL